MLYIQKRRTPDMIKSKASEIVNTSGSGYSMISLPENTKQLQGNAKAEPYIGVRLYFYKRRYRRLE